MKKENQNKNFMKVDKREDDLFVNQKISNERKSLELSSCFLQGEITISTPGNVVLNNCAFEAFSEVVITGSEIELNNIVVVVSDKYDNVYMSKDSEHEYILVHLNGEAAKITNAKGKILLETSNLDQLIDEGKENVTQLDGMKVR